MVQAAEHAAVEIAVGLLCLRHRERILPARVAHRPHRVFHRIGVEVADHQFQAAALAGGIGLQPCVQSLRRLHAQRIPAGLAVALVGIGAGGTGTTLGLQMIGNDDESGMLAMAEGLRQRYPAAGLRGNAIERPAFQRCGFADRGDTALAIDQADPDLVAARSLPRIDVAPVATLRVQRIDELGEA